MAQPHIIVEIDEMRRHVLTATGQGRTVGVVPTMGALHDGHLSLVDRARAMCDVIVTTIFVNPTQFGPLEDLDRYPRTWDDDIRALTLHQCDYVFAPTRDAMFPATATTRIQPPAVASPLEGEHRPGHFSGVATVVLKLFQIIPADAAFFGEKDFQQCLVIEHMVRDLNLPIRLVGCPIIRESDGLAMSSRNRYLTADERRRALGLYQALLAARQLITDGESDVPEIERLANETLTRAGVDQIDYATVRHAETLEPIDRIIAPCVLLIAARVGSTRLIDNSRLA